MKKEKPSAILKMMRKCITCNKISPCFHYPHEEKSLHCSSCKLETMVDGKNEKCITCNKKRPPFNCPNEKKKYIQPHGN